MTGAYPWEYSVSGCSTTLSTSLTATLLMSPPLRARFANLTHPLGAKGMTISGPLPVPCLQILCPASPARRLGSQVQLPSTQPIYLGLQSTLLRLQLSQTVQGHW